MPTARITRTWSSKYPTRAAAYHARTCRAFGAVRSSCRTKSCSHCILAYAALCFLSRQTSSPRPLQRLATSSRAHSPRAAITRPTHRSRDSDTGYPYHARTHAILVEISISWCMPNGSLERSGRRVSMPPPLRLCPAYMIVALPVCWTWQSMEGYGTDAFLHLPRLGDRDEPLH